MYLHVYICAWKYICVWKYKRQKKDKYCYDLTFGESTKPKLTETEITMMAARGEGHGGWRVDRTGDSGQKEQTFRYKILYTACWL